MKMLLRKKRFMHFCFFWHENELWSNLVEMQQLVNVSFFKPPFSCFPGADNMPASMTGVGANGLGGLRGSDAPASSDGRVWELRRNGEGG